MAIVDTPSLKLRSRLRRAAGKVIPPTGKALRSRLRPDQYVGRRTADRHLGASGSPVFRGSRSRLRRLERRRSVRAGAAKEHQDVSRGCGPSSRRSRHGDSGPLYCSGALGGRGGTGWTEWHDRGLTVGFWIQHLANVTRGFESRLRLYLTRPSSQVRDGFQNRHRRLRLASFPASK